MQGRFLARVEPGRAAPFRVESGVPGGCRETLRVVWPRSLPAPPTGVFLEGVGRWEGRGFPEPGRAEWAGRLRLAADPAPRQIRGGAPLGRFLRIRGVLQDRIVLLFGERAPVVEALVLARKEHLDPDLREAFGLSGTAHLLAISGFHVGVVAGLLLGILRMLRLRPRQAAAAAAAGSWLYVLGIGAPDAALRAAVILTLLAASRLRGVPAVSVGTLSSAFLLLLALDPVSLASVGFQLSFAGTLGLITLRRPLDLRLQAWVRAACLRMGWRPPRQGPSATSGERWLRGSSEGLVAGVAATLPTLPLLAWHFDRVSVVGVLATLAVAPGVAVAIPGIGASLLLSWVAHPLGAFLAGGVGLILAAVEAGVRVAAALPGASVWVSRPALVTALLVGPGVAGILRRMGPRAEARRLRRGTRWGAGCMAAATLVLLLPMAPGSRPLEIHILDVGQGDAAALRLPNGRWILVDAGPASPGGWDAGHRRVIPHLRRHGARAVELMVLTHAHLDHVGGAAAILRGMPVRGVLEPGRATPSGAYLEALQEAEARGTWWWGAQAGRRVIRGGVEFTVLHPPPPHPDSTTPGPGDDPNQASVVLLIRYGRAAALFTGDAYADVEEAILDELPPLTVLKAGHHGSRTSTSRELLAATRPAVAVVSAGDNNRYGHPHAEVVARVEEVGALLARTDRDGTLRIRLHRDGRWELSTGR